MQKLIVYLMLIGLFLLHQDYWNWEKDNLVLGFLPEGMAYHSLYSIVTAICFFICIKLAWPHHLERWAGESDEPEAAE